MSDTAPSFTFEDAPSSSSSSTGKRGPGRPKGSKNAPRATPTQTQINADVKQALSTLDAAYNLAATGLMVVGANETAEAWAETAEDLRKSNEESLRASPRLARAIASAGSTSGAATFLIAHGMAVVTIGRMAQAELRAKLPRTPTVPEESVPADDPTLIPGAVPESVRMPFSPGHPLHFG